MVWLAKGLADLSEVVGLEQWGRNFGKVLREPDLNGLEERGWARKFDRAGEPSLELGALGSPVRDGSGRVKTCGLWNEFQVEGPFEIGGERHRVPERRRERVSRRAAGDRNEGSDVDIQQRGRFLPTD